MLKGFFFSVLPTLFIPGHIQASKTTAMGASNSRLTGDEMTTAFAHSKENTFSWLGTTMFVLSS